MKVHVEITNNGKQVAEMDLELTALMAFGPAALKALLAPEGNVVTLTKAED